MLCVPTAPYLYYYFFKSVFIVKLVLSHLEYCLNKYITSWQHTKKYILKLHEVYTFMTLFILRISIN